MGSIEDLLTVFAAVVGVALASWAAITNAQPKIKGRLKDNPDYRARVAAELEAPKASVLYLRGLDRALGGLDHLMGPINLWPGVPLGFGFCLTLAFVYSSLFLVFGWGFFGASGRIGPLGAMPDWTWWARAGTGFGVTIYVAIMFFMIQRDVVAGAGGRITVGVFGGAVAGAVTGAAGAGAAVAGGVAGAGMAVAIATVAAGAGAFVAGAALAGAIIGALVAGLGEDGFGMLLLWVALPIANAGPDVVSWWVSRGLGRRLQATIEADLAYLRKAVAAIGHVALDLIAALGFFALIAFLLPRIADLVNGFAVWAGSDLALQLWEPGGLVCQTARDPWGEGAWPMLMLLSTLVPTALHFGMVLLSFWASWWLRLFEAPEVAAGLRKGEAIGGTALTAAIDEAASRLTWAWFGAIVTFSALLTLLWVGFGQLEHALPWIDQGLDLFKRLMLLVAYGFDDASVTACLGV